MEITKRCTQCTHRKPVSAFVKNRTMRDGYASACRACRKTQGAADYKKYKAKILRKQRVFRRDNPVEIRAKDRAHWLRKAYRLTTPIYEQMLRDQNGVCKICLRPPTTRFLSVDHCHKTGRVRGLLCHKCNSVLGLVDDDMSILMSAFAYLRRALPLGAEGKVSTCYGDH